MTHDVFISAFWVTLPINGLSRRRKHDLWDKSSALHLGEPFSEAGLGFLRIEAINGSVVKIQTVDFRLIPRVISRSRATSMLPLILVSSAVRLREQKVMSRLPVRVIDARLHQSEGLRVRNMVFNLVFGLYEPRITNASLPEFNI